MALPDKGDPTDREGVPPTIRELVQSYRDATGDSYHTLEARSAADGQRVHFSYFRRLNEGSVRAFPTNPETFTGIARALRTTELAVVLGYARQLGIPVRMPAFAAQVPSSADAIPPEEQRVLLQYLRVRSTDKTAQAYSNDGDVTPEEIEQRGMLPGRRPATRQPAVEDDNEEHPGSAKCSPQ